MLWTQKAEPVEQGGMVDPHTNNLFLKKIFRNETCSNKRHFDMYWLPAPLTFLELCKGFDD